METIDVYIELRGPVKGKTFLCVPQKLKTKFVRTGRIYNRKTKKFIWRKQFNN